MAISILRGVSRVFFTGAVTAERDSNSATGWTVTGWQQGLPVARKPITAAALQELMNRCPHTVSHG